MQPMTFRLTNATAVLDEVTVASSLELTTWIFDAVKRRGLCASAISVLTPSDSWQFLTGVNPDGPAWDDLRKLHGDVTAAFNKATKLCTMVSGAEIGA